MWSRKARDRRQSNRAVRRLRLSRSEQREGYSYVGGRKRRYTREEIARIAETGTGWPA